MTVSTAARPSASRLVASRRRARARARTVEALALMTAAAAAQKWVPMTRWSDLLGQSGEVPQRWHGEEIVSLPSRAASLTERRVAGSVRRASQLLPWEPSCLAQATAGQVMLRRRHEPGVVVIGLRRPDPEERRPTQKGRWDAHAWLLGRAGALTGGPAARGFTATTVFVPPRAPDPESLQFSP